MNNEILRYDPTVFVVGESYQILFLTTTKGLSRVEIGDKVYETEEGGLPKYGCVHAIRVPKEALDAAGKYTVVFTEYADKKAYFPVGVEKARREYDFFPLPKGDVRIFQFADTHGQVDAPLKTYAAVGDCDMIVLNGDINNSSDEIEQFYTAFALSAGAVRGTRPVIYSRGNHDTRGRCAQELLDYIPTDFRDGRRETFYTFRAGDIWGLVLDCGEDKYDSNIEYGGTARFEPFRERETRYLEALLESGEYKREGIAHRIAFSHLPLTEKFEPPFDVSEKRYAYWVELLGKMGVEMLVCGHMHEAYILPPHAQGKCDAAFPTAVLSIPEKKLADGSTVYIGGLIEIKNGKVTAKAVPEAE